MNKALSPLLQISLCIVGYLYATSNSTLAQVTSDGTVNTQVNQNGNVAEITGGETRGDNLFHSFQDFSVPTNNEAFFNNATDISNIFSRVTGGNISSIDGAIRANGSASLFLINPAGIIFGENARLDIGGSFYGSTASSILFEDGEFSAVDLENPPLLTINAPIGLGFRDEPGEIINRSFVQNSAEEFVGLEVEPGNNLAFIGGDINFERGNLTAQGGNIELGGLSQAGTVGINPDGSLSFPDGVIKADINLSNAADVDARGTGDGSVSVNARNLNLSAGEEGSSFIRAGIRAESTSAEAQAGNITIDVAENITLDNSFINNRVDEGAVGNSGNIIINTSSLEANNGARISGTTEGQGNAGLVNITATEDITFDGEDPEGNASGAISLVNEGAVGNAGSVVISTTNLNLSNGGLIVASTESKGNAGTVDITATGDITFAGEDPEGFPSVVLSGVASGAEGNAGGVSITTKNLSLVEGAFIDASTVGQGNAGTVDITATGDITFDGEGLRGFPSGATSVVATGAVGNAGGVTIDTANLTLTNGGRVSASTLDQGNAGSVDLTATGDITIDGETLDGTPSGATSLVNRGAVGDAGGVTISTTNLTLTNGGRVDANTLDQGNAGSVDITATGNIIFDGESSPGGIPSGATSLVDTDAVGDAGGVTISTTNLTLTNGGRVAADTFGQGNAGSVDLTATGDITFDGETSGGTPSGATSRVESDAVGDAGGVTIDTANLTLTNGGRVDASTAGQGNAGSVDLTTTGDIIIDGETSGGFGSGATSLVDTGAVGDAGGVTIDTANLDLTNGGRISASTFGQGNAGSVNINATESIFISGAIERFRSGISANALVNNGNGGNIFINTGNLTIANSGTIEATNFDNGGNNNSSGTGQPGNINITANSLELTDNARIDAATQFESTTQSEEGESGNIDLTVTKDIRLRENSFISAQAFGDADGGNLDIDARFIVAFSSSGIGNDLVATADQGRGGTINLDVEQIFGLAIGEGIDDETGDFINNNRNDIDASSQVLGLDGTVNINSSRINPVQGATELPTNVVEPEQTTAQACQANREVAAKNGLNITGKGGIPPEPGLPLNSLNVTVNGETNPISAIPQPIATSIGKIQPARGIKVTESGEIILTAYRTNNSGERIPEIKPNCS